MLRKSSWIALLALLIMPHAVFAAAYMRTVSWNLRHEGWSGETDYAGDAAQIWNQYGSTSGSANGCDIVFLQEVMYSSVPASIASALTTKSGYTWASAYVGPIGRSSYKEYYAVVYRTDRVTLLSNTMWTDTGDKFEREPQIVKVRDKSTNADYTFINWHAVWGNGGTDVHNEVKQIDNVFASVQSGSSSDQDVLLVGDTNLNATHSAWSELYGLSPAVSNYNNIATTINSSGSYVSAYDHYFAQSSYVTEISSYGRDYIANTTTHYNNFSDHAPIWLRLYSSSDTD
ncbi:deoxyribonuclease I [Candidatus Sumerlaeota bacterium]|nr:deoxyribonuclease I [Candidatus Sumerlaeota bacterium]